MREVSDADRVRLTVLRIVGLDSKPEQESGSGRQVQRRAGVEPNIIAGSCLL